GRAEDTAPPRRGFPGSATRIGGSRGATRGGDGKITPLSPTGERGGKDHSPLPPSSNRFKRAVHSSSAPADQAKSCGALKPPSVVNVAVGAGHKGSTPSDCPLTVASNAVTCARSPVSSVPGATIVGPSVISTSCSCNTGGWTVPVTWAWTRT